MTTKRYKIAVCISGQSRTWRMGIESILSYFSSDVHEYYFFGHTWDTNSWKHHFINPHSGKKQRSYLHEKIGCSKLYKDISESCIPFTSLMVSPQCSEHNKGEYYTWAGMCKSAMLANHLKQKFEIDNNIEFDLVVRTRWDTVHQQFEKFDNSIPEHLMHCPNILFCTTVIDFVNEYRLPAVDDISYFGSSYTMDVIDSFYHYYFNGKFYEACGTNWMNKSYKNVGMGVLLYKWAGMNNILIKETNFRAPIVTRIPKSPLKWPEDYEQMRSDYMNFEAV